jgi:pilus assembly protein Flp/PilA
MRWSRSKVGTCWTGVNQSEAHMKKFISRFMKNEAGVTAIEYGLIAALVAVVIIGAVTTMGSNLSTTFSSVAASL